jgi:WD40 repeat protein
MNGFNRSVAVILAVNSYDNGIPSLRTAVNDAQALGKQLEKNYSYDVILRTDQEAGLAQLRQLLTDELPSQLGASDRVLFYFAGHGVAADGDDGPVGYLIPQDARREDVGTFLPMQELHDLLTALPCRHFLAILDCCFAGAFRWSSMRDLRPLPSVIHRERYERFILDQAWQVITSAAHDQKALDVLAGEAVGRRGDGQAHSPFARVLLKALEGAADLVPPGGDGVITATELYLYLRDEIDLLTKSMNLRQTAGLWPLRKHDKGEFVFVSPDRKLDLPPAPALTESSNPYRGLQAFEEGHKDLFFGRKRVGLRLFKTVLKRPLTVVVGASGSGKSSLVKAGLVPWLRTRKKRRWQILSSFRPGNFPLQSLVKQISLPESPLANYSKDLSWESDKTALTKSINAWAAANPGQKLLIIVDQFEELLTLCRSDIEREQFLALLADALEARSEWLRICLTVRSDFEPQFLSSLLGKNWRQSRFVVPPMTQDELREVIEGPASARVLYFESPGLVDRLINEVVQMPGALPLLSFTLSEMYFSYLKRKGDDRALTQQDYESLGGVAGSIRQRANHEYDSLKDEAERATMRRVMLRMVEFGAGELTRRRVRKQELNYVGADENIRVDHVIKQLSEARLIVEGKEVEGEPYLEPAHDALVNAWDKLWLWVRSEHDNLLLQRRLSQATDEWYRGEQDSGQLWDKDPRLPQVRTLGAANPDWFNERETLFLSKSVRQRKLRLARLFGSIAAVILLLTASTIALYLLRNRALVQESIATNRARIALSRQLAAQSLNVLAEHPDLALLLAVHASETAETFEARSSLLSTLEFAPNLVGFLHGHTSPATSIAFSPDGKVLAAGGVDRTVALWDPTTRKLLMPALKQHRATVNCVAFSPDGQLLASGSSDGEVFVWDTSTYQPIGEAFKVQAGGVNSLAFTKDSKFLAASGTRSTSILLWNISTHALDRSLDLHKANVRTLVFSPDGKLLASGDDDGATILWNTVTWQASRPEKFGGAEKNSVNPNQSSKSNTILTDVSSLAFSADGHTLAVASGTAYDIVLWDVTTHRSLGRLEGHTGVITTLAFSPDGKVLASGSLDDTIILWDVANKRPLADAYKGHQAGVTGVQFSPDGKSLASCGFRDNAVFVWDVTNQQSLGVTISGHKTPVKSLAVSATTGGLASGGEDRKILSWDLSSWRLTNELPTNFSTEVSSLSYSANGQFLAASGLESNNISVWNLNAANAAPMELKGHTKWVHCVAFSPDGKTLVSGSWDRTLIIWDVATWQQIGAPLQGHVGYVNSLAFSPDGKILASGSGPPVPSPNFQERSIILWNTATREMIGKPLIKQQGSINALAFNPSGELLASGSDDNSIVLWDVRTSQATGAPLTGHQAAVESLAFSPDGKILASCGSDGGMILWDVETRRPIGRLLRSHLIASPGLSPSARLNSLVFDPKGRFVIAGSDNSTLTVWPTDFKDWRARALRIANRDFTDQERKQYLVDPTPYLEE